MEPQTIAVKGAREHNLRNVSLTLPRNRLICLTGVSGSGKSSFAFDTLYAEGQRRYIESLSSYARQFLGQLPKPDVDLITGLSPAVSIQQKKAGWNPRSTVGTITQIHDYLRVLYARLGKQHCPQCGLPISAQTRDQIVQRILAQPEGSKVMILAPVVRGQKGEYRDLFDELIRDGYTRARVDGQVLDLATAPRLDRNLKHHIEVVIDRLVLKGDIRLRLGEAVEAALKKGEGTLIVAGGESENRVQGCRPGDSSTGFRVQKGARKRGTPATAGKLHAERGTIKTGQSEIGNRQSTIDNSDLLLSSDYACGQCGISFEPPSPQLFSFNSPTGMCLTCDGLGTCFDFDIDLIVPDDSLSFLQNAIEPMRVPVGRWRRHIYEGVARTVGFDLRTPWRKLSAEAKHALLHGMGDRHVTYEWRASGGVFRHGSTFPGVLAELRERHRKSQSGMVRGIYEKYMRQTLCPDCGGARLNRQALAVRIGGRNLHELCALSIADAAAFVDSLELTATEQIIAQEVLKEVRGRLQFLIDVGLSYLNLNRAAPTLAGGESQRIRLASQIGSGLVGVLYILDEPSIGLHPRDNRKLLDSLLTLRDMGNTVVVVEHDEETMRTADWVVDFGPGPGVRGGRVVGEGTVDELMGAEESVTGKFLAGEERIEVPKERRVVVPPPLATEVPQPAGKHGNNASRTK